MKKDWWRICTNSLLLHLLLKGNFLRRSFPYIAIYYTVHKFFKGGIIKNNCLLQQPSNFLTDEYYNPRKLRLMKIKINKIFTAKIFHNMKKLTKYFFWGDSRGGAIFRGAVFLGGLFPGSNFLGGTFPGGNFPSTVIDMHILVCLYVFDLLPIV